MYISCLVYRNLVGERVIANLKIEDCTSMSKIELEIKQFLVS